MFEDKHILKAGFGICSVKIFNFIYHVIFRCLLLVGNTNGDTTVNKGNAKRGVFDPVTLTFDL